MSPVGGGADSAAFDVRRLCQALEKEGALSGAELLASRPHLFSAAQVRVSEADLTFMARLIAAIEAVIARPAAQAHFLARAPVTAQHIPRAAGVFFGYDFHLSEAGPRLIEINTNAGGALLNARLRAAHGLADAAALDAAFLAMFREEWQCSRGDQPLACIAIVDETPDTQYLQPEFVLFRALFEAAGIQALIADPAEFVFDRGALFCRGQRVDLVYNRLTDFALEEVGNTALREAWLADAVVLTPHPRAHALYADKRNLAALSDAAWLNEVGVDAATQDLLLAGIPKTITVRSEDAAALWADRRHFFFKPAGGYGSKATYRGDKLTRRVFEEIIRGGYVAQALVPPSLCTVPVDGVDVELKLDLRNYVYRGAVQLVAARLYQGQTTNFRTPGGGFAPITSFPETPGCAGAAVS